MPGLVGFTRRGIEGERDALEKMQRMIKHRAFYVDDPLFTDEFVAATRTDKGIVQREMQPLESDGIHVWLKGEFHNQDEVIRTAGFNSAKVSDPELLLRLYRDDLQLSFLSRIDGIYSAVLYDAPRKVVHLITDRYGLGYLYWTVQGGILSWSSEVKAFLAAPQFEAAIDLHTVENFFRGGHPFENRTWFEGVELVPPGTVLSWDLREKKLTKTAYWLWKDIPLQTEAIDEDEIVEEMGRLWIDSVRRRSVADVRVGVSLSGGLDSRAIIAAIPDPGYPLHALTVGNPRCDDVRIARRVAEVKGATHHVFDLNAENWLRLRPSAVWWSDGHIDMKHMHGCVLIDQVREYYDINLSGISGGPIMGGLYLEHTGGDRQQELKVFPNRGRRFSPCHVQAVDDVFFHSRLPFLDNALVEFVLSIPPDARSAHKLYKRMLLQRFPNFYRHIPWQKTGLEIDASKTARKAKAFSESVGDLVMRVGRKVGSRHLQRIVDNKFHHYDLWLRQKPGRDFVDAVLRDQNAIYPAYIDKAKVDQAWSTHLEGGDRTRSLCQYMTFEIWLQQVYNGSYRNGIDGDQDEVKPSRTAMARSAA